MPAWFERLTDPQRDAWLNAWEDGSDVPTELLETLPNDRRPGTPGEAVELVSWSWWVVAGNKPGPNYRMTEDLEAFLSEEHGRRRG